MGSQSGDATDLAGVFVQILPLAVAASSFLMLVINLWLGGRISEVSQRLTRPWPNIADGLRLPRPAAAIFALGILPAFLGGALATAAATVAAALGMAFALQGLATAHVLTRGFAGRRAILALIYLVTLLIPLSIVALTLLGVLDCLISLRTKRPPMSPTHPTNRRYTMEVILLERVAKLGQMGERVRVKDGFARNFLLPRGKALRATEANAKRFETQRVQLETRNLERRAEAETVAEQLDGQSFVIIRQAGETGQLYGSVSTRDVAETITAGGFSVSRDQVVLSSPIKAIGLHAVPVQLHPEVDAKVTINVARSPEEAERQAKGEEINVREETSLDDLGLEVGAALAESEGSLGDR